jgi:hypothetical protein
MALLDGSFVAGNLRRLAWLEADGSTRAATDLGEPVQALAFTGKWVVAITRSGTVFGWDGNRAAWAIADFGDELRSNPMVVGGALVALTRSGLRELDPSTARVHSWVTGIDVPDRTPLVLLAQGQVAWLDRDNTLERAAASGRVDKQPLGPETTSIAATLPPVSDATGAVALLNALGELTLIDAANRVTSDGEVRCGAPVALLPQRHGRLLLACSSGSIWAFGP